MDNQKALSNAMSSIPEAFAFISCPLPTSSSTSRCFGTEGSNSPPVKIMQRILPLGAIIVFGYESIADTLYNHNGFREPLRELIVAAGGQVNYVGSRQSGTMNDSDAEATIGFTIDQARGALENSLPYLPNIVLIHVGSNDMSGPIDVPNAHLRLGNIIDRILSSIPGVVIIVSTLIPNTNPTTESYTETFNANIINMVNARKESGQLVHVVDIHDPNIFTTADLGPDGKS
jgi:lysophospholipase L1-like esterase